MSVFSSHGTGEAFVSLAPAAGPFPSEAAIYAGAVLSAT